MKLYLVIGRDNNVKAFYDTFAESKAHRCAAEESEGYDESVPIFEIEVPRPTSGYYNGSFDYSFDEGDWEDEED